jgi:hypothetical protein
VKAIASGAVLVEKSEAEQVYRLKTTYNEKIVPLLIEEFSYTNIHQVFVKFRFFFVMGIPCNCLILRFCWVLNESLSLFWFLFDGVLQFWHHMVSKMLWSHGFIFWVDGVFQFWYSK